MTREGFTRYVKEWAKQGIPFTAYRYRYGYGRLMTVRLRREPYSTWKVRSKDGETYEYHSYDAAAQDAKPGAKPREVKHLGDWYGPTKTEVARWRRSVERLRRRYSWDGFVTAEFDGTTITYEEAL